MITLPAEQDRLLKELNNIDVQEREGIRPERSNTNLFLVILLWLFGLIISLVAISNGRSFYVSRILGLCFATSIGLIGSFYNKKWGYYFSCIMAIVFNIYASLQYPNYKSELTTLLDGITIFIFSNQFGKEGYTVGATLIIGKLSYIFFQFDDLENLELYFASIINILTMGFIPVLIESISRFSRKARKQEIRAEILSLQNQDLLGSWQQFYQASPKSENQTTEEPATTQPVPQTDITEDVNYISPYVKSAS